jgi:hypothetical protein
VGLLDDAIREHLDLKRRAGASEEEIARKEAEALGPARRDFPRTVEAQEEAAQETAQHEQLPDPAVEAREPERFPAEPDAEPFAPEPELEEPPAYEPPVAQPAPPPEVQPPTEEYFIEDEEEPLPHGDELDEERPPEPEPPRPEARDEDMLEDTPEFLQETPEHDRLWFEQKPPRDFDFD